MPDLTSEELVAHSRFVHALAKSLLFDQHEAADVAQDALVAALENGAAVRRSVRGWLAGVVRNRARETLRSGSRRIAREQKAARADRVPAAAEAAGRVEMQQRLVDALSALDEEHRTVLVLRFFDGLPPRRIAHRLGISVESVKSRQKRGLYRLRGLLDREFGSRRAWCLAVAPLLLAKPVAAATVAVGGTTQLVLGGLAMKAGAIVVAAVAVSTVAVGVVLAPSNDTPTRVDPARTEARGPTEPMVESPDPEWPDSVNTPEAGESMEAPKAPDTAAPDTKPLFGDALRQRSAQREAMDMSVVLADRMRLAAMQEEEARVRAALTNALSSAVAPPDPRRPDTITRDYLVAMTEKVDGLEPGRDRTELLNRIARVHRDYLGRTGDYGFMDWLDGAMDRASGWGEQRALADGLRGASGRAAAEMLVKWARDRDPHVRYVAVRAFTDLKGSARDIAAAPALHALQDANPRVRDTAARAVRYVAYRSSSLPALTDALSAETDPKVATTMAVTILRLEPKTARSRLTAAVRQSSPAVKKAVEKILP
ncbi:MAG: sigma-70 family RNA polymerase sigma factor [Planctomycetota bacterium]|jgi:RNA polymerase sigma-70 factor (ECF subfamily)